MLLLLVVVLGTLLCRTYLPGRIPFSNDGPFGRLMAECHRLPARFTGCWEDLNLLGDRDEYADSHGDKRRRAQLVIIHASRWLVQLSSDI